MQQTDTDQVRSLLRLSGLRRLGILDSPPEAGFDRLARAAARVLAAPVALITIVDEDRQFFKSCIGLPEPWSAARETPLSHSFCQHVVTSRAPLVVPDARLHPMLRDNAAIHDLGVVAYIGVPLLTSEGIEVGAFCVIDGVPRAWSEADLEILSDLAFAVINLIEYSVLLRRNEEAAREPAARVRRVPGAALGALFDEWAPRLYPLAHAVTQDEAGADEALLHGLEEAWRNRSAGEVTPSYPAVAYRVWMQASARRLRDETMPESQRCAVDLALFAKLKVSEIAQVMGASRTVVMEWMRQGLKHPRAARA